MKATLEFQLPEEEEFYRQAAAAQEAFCLLAEIDTHLRSVVKHGAGGYKSAEELAEHIRSDIAEILDRVR